MIGFLIQLISNLIFVRFANTKVLKFYKIVACFVFPIVVIMAMILKIFFMLAEYGAPDASAFATNYNVFVSFAVLGLTSLGFQLVFNFYALRLKERVGNKKS